MAARPSFNSGCSCGRPDSRTLTRARSRFPRGQPAMARAVDFALGPAGSLYVSYGMPRKPHAWLSRLTATGQRALDEPARYRESATPSSVSGRMARSTRRWTRRAAGRATSWVPAATPAGRPLSTAYQLRRRLHYQPLPGGLRLVSSIGREGKNACGPVPAERRFALINRAGRLLRAWRITSGTQITESLSATPALVGGDPVVVLLVRRPSGPAGNPCRSVEDEYLVLRLARSGPSRIALFAGGAAARTTRTRADVPGGAS